MEHPTPFADPLYRSAFERFREMPSTIFDSYFEIMRIPSERSGVLLDVGAGPGIQTALLASRLPQDWRVLGIEPSAELCGAARTRVAHFGSRVEIIQGAFLDGLPGSYSAAWLSEVAHLLGDPVHWSAELMGVIRPRGRVLVRTSTHDQLAARQWYRFFPRALDIDVDRHPKRADVLRALGDHGFVDLEVHTVDESRLVSTDLVQRMFRERAFSTLHYLTDVELARGLSEWADAEEGQDNCLWHYEMTAYTATRDDKHRVRP